MVDSLEFRVSNNELDAQFETKINGEFAYLQYIPGKDSISLIHTFTPMSLRGKGIASAVTRFALDYAKEKRLQVIAGCSFVAEYINRHPEYKPLLLKNSVR